MTKKTNEEVIKSESPEVEHGYIKFPRERLIPVTKESSEEEFYPDDEKILEEIKKRGGKRVLALHTHPYSPYYSLRALPSPEDLYQFENRPFEKTMAILQRDEDTGDNMGCTMLFKDDEKRLANKSAKKRVIARYAASVISSRNADTPLEDLESVFDNCSIGGIRFHPMKGYYFDRRTGNYERRIGLRSKAKMVFIGASFLVSLFFFSFNITGKVIDISLSAGDGNILGIVFLLIGLIGIILYFIKRGQRKENTF